MQRGYSLLTIKSVDAERRLIFGTATTPTLDRVGDILEPKGASFAADLPLLLFHDTRLPVGTVQLQKATDAGIEFQAQLPDVQEPPALRDRISEAWASIRAGLLRGVSVGFRAADDGVERLKSGGLRFTKFEILELSLVAVPANSEAVISAIKAIDAAALAATGTGSASQPGASGTTVIDELHAHKTRDLVVSLRRSARPMTIKDQLKDFEATREAKNARMTALMTTAAEKGETLDEAGSQEYDGLQGELEKIDQHLVRLHALEQANRTAAKPVEAPDATKGMQSRDPQHVVISVKENRPPGIGFARAALAQIRARLDSQNVLDVAKALWPSDQELHKHFEIKATVPAGTSTQTVWAGPLVYPTNLASEFIEYLRPMTIVDRIPGFRRVPFNVRVTGQTSGGTGYWVGEGAPKPLTSFAFEAITLGYTKVAAIAVITQELARFSSPSAEMLVRDSLAAALVERLDRDFIDPAEAGTTSVQPASVTNGLVALSSAGPTADNIRTDLANLISTFIAANVNPSGLVLVMPNTLALGASLLVNALGQPEFPGLTMNGGTLSGIPVITSQYAANASGSGNLVIAINARDILLADDGNVTIDASQEASLQMSDAPTMNSATGTGVSVVSMYQTNSIALRAERFINWKKARTTAVVYMDDVNWSSVGSP